MSKATFYEHFDNKEDCIVALFDAAIEVILGAMRAAGERERGRATRASASAPPAEAFLAVLDARSPTRRRRCWWRSSARARARWSAATGCSTPSRSTSTSSTAATTTAAPPRASPRRTTPSRSSARSSSSPRGSSAPAARPTSHELEPVVRAPRHGPARPTRAGVSAAHARASQPRSPTAAAARASSSGASRSRARSAPRSATGRTGAARSPASATRARGCSCSASRPRRTAPTAPGASSPATAPATSSSPALHRAGYANQPTSVSLDDGLELRDCFITAAVRCAPPANKPLPERARPPARTGSRASWRCSSTSRVVLCLGGFAWDAGAATPAVLGGPAPRPRPRFGHGAELAAGPRTLLGCFHPSQQNTFTGKLTAGDARRRARPGRADARAA